MGNQLSATLPEDWATVDMVAQFAYCPRRFHLMYIEGRWEDNTHTLEGKITHRRVDRVDHLLPEAGKKTNDNSETLPDSDGVEDDDPPPEIARSVSLGSAEIGLLGKLDLVSADPEGGEAIPVETKKGRVPPTPERSYPPERAQLMAQGLLLRAHDYQSNHGYIYYAASRSRVRIEFTAELEAETREIIATVRTERSASRMPPPLEDSPKCWNCSLCGICLPDETNALRSSGENEKPSPSADSKPDQSAGPDIRRLFAARDRAIPFYIQEQGAKVGKQGQRLTVTKSSKLIGSARLIEISQLILIGNIQISAQALHLMMEKGLPVVHFSTGGWFHGISHGITIENAYSRSAQFAAAAKPDRCATFARKLVETKTLNQRALLMRNGNGRKKKQVVNELARQLKLWHRKSANQATSLAEIRGLEGQAAALYFSAFASMLKTTELEPFHFNSRNRRPPLDPVNALLSFTYAVLAKECVVALWAEGLDPWWGLYHQPRHGRPSLALDLMEPFRPIIADSVVITAINTGMVGAKDFVTNSNGCALRPTGRKSLLRAWEHRLDQLYTHPLFNYRCSWRTILRIQARLLTRWLRGDIPEIPWPTVR
ncbi:MAG: CRISPR-associated exonuclease Cas4/endonuclease Cas1 fusion [Verrucomicrobia subdivision 3 bacterium]|nr:CRISPR-associated exonuclease Cas4/endonuclease Cas1 fusion [Limisphaerales bacterium]MCS1413681.1 CRISPR-associated exonuclease Cas4/endonuclease Cas1 fusion [Limisphaerales bacterium]